MKHFIDNNAQFEIMIPATWKYSLIDEKIHTFKEYEKWKFNAFQISLRDNSSSFNLNPITKYKSEIIGNDKCYCLPDTIEPDFTTKAWVSVIDEKIVFFTLTYSMKPVDETPLNRKLEIAKKAISEFRIINENDKANKLNAYRFEMFMQGVGATATILNNAIKNKAFIEATCILSNQIDSLLRIGIVLKKQLLNKNSVIETEWIYQGINDKKKSEKDIYKKAKEIGIIDENIFDELYILYEDRNRVIHRFIISEITLADVEDIAYNYYLQQEKINKIIYDIESEQIKLNVGMTSTNSGTETWNERKAFEFIKGKIGKLDYFDKKPAGNKL